MDPTLRLRRTGTRQGVAGNGRGATVRFGPADVDGAFTPGELLAVALAACNLMSADFPIARRVGEHVELTGEVTAVKDAATNRYAEASVRLAVGGADHLDEQAWQELVAAAARAVDRACTVGRTVDHDLPHSLTIERS